MARLDTQRQSDLEPKRMKYCFDSLMEMGHLVSVKDNTTLIIETKSGIIIQFYPYSGWFSGKKPIGQGRGFKNLLKALKKEQS